MSARIAYIDDSALMLGAILLSPALLLLVRGPRRRPSPLPPTTDPLRFPV